jgi:hypothetical protein
MELNSTVASRCCFPTKKTSKFDASPANSLSSGPLDLVAIQANPSLKSEPWETPRITRSLHIVVYYLYSSPSRTHGWEYRSYHERKDDLDFLPVPLEAEVPLGHHLGHGSSRW